MLENCFVMIFAVFSRLRFVFVCRVYCNKTSFTCKFLEYQYWVTPNGYGFQLFWRLLEPDACCWCCVSSKRYWRWISAKRWISLKLTFCILFLDEATEEIETFGLCMSTNYLIFITSMFCNTKSNCFTYMIFFQALDVPFVIDTCTMD